MWVLMCLLLLNILLCKCLKESSKGFKLQSFFADGLEKMYYSSILTKCGTVLLVKGQHQQLNTDNYIKKYNFAKRILEICTLFLKASYIVFKYLLWIDLQFTWIQKIENQG